MKKLLFLVTMLAISLITIAQQNGKTGEPRSFLVLHAGPSLPVEDFHSSVFTNTDAGFAKTGFNINLSYGYQLAENLGLVANGFYNNNTLDNATIQRQMENEMNLNAGELAGLKLDHWKWYGLTIGPAMMHNLNPKLAVDVRVMGGIANANTPRIRFENEELVSEDWAVTGVFQAGADTRIVLGNNLFVILNAEYTYMKPKFHVTSNIQETVAELVKQKISVVNVTAGLGIRF